MRCRRPLGSAPVWKGCHLRLEGVPPRRSGRGASSKVWKGCLLEGLEGVPTPILIYSAVRARRRLSCPLTPSTHRASRLLPAPHSQKRPCATRALRRQVPQAQRVARLELLARPARGARSPEGGGAAHDAGRGSEGHQPVVCVPRRAGKVSVACSSALGSSLCVVLILSLSLCAVLAAACLVVA